MRTDYNFTQRFGSLGMTRIPSHYMRGLGFSDAEEYTGPVGEAISAIPIPGAQQIGAAITAIGGLVDKLFGWGDTTPITTLYNKVVELRLQLAEENRAAGIPDTFQIPAGLDDTNEGELESLALVVVNDYLKMVPDFNSSMDTSLTLQHTWAPKLWSAYVHNARDDLYKTIAWLANKLGIANIADTNTALTTPPPQTVMQVSPPVDYISPPAGETDPNSVYTPPAPQPNAPASPTTPTVSPMLLIGGGFGVVLLAMMLSRG